MPLNTRERLRLADRRERYLDLADELRRCVRDGDKMHMEVLLLRLQTMMGLALPAVPEATAPAD